MNRIGVNDGVVAGILFVFAVAAFLPEFVDGFTRP